MQSPDYHMNSLRAIDKDFPITVKDVKGVAPGVPRHLCVRAVEYTCVWWPKMDEEFEREMKSCSICQHVWISTPSAALTSWKWPARHFRRIHIDFCQKRSEYFLIVFFVILKQTDVQHFNYHREDHK